MEKFGPEQEFVCHLDRAIQLRDKPGVGTSTRLPPECERRPKCRITAWLEL